MSELPQPLSLKLDESTFRNIGHSLNELAARIPEQVAICTATESITYREFNLRVNRVAHEVLEKTKSEPARVGILFDQSSEAIIAIFGVLKAGSAFVPLDASYPESKLIEICDSCSPAIILADGSKALLAHSLSTASKVPIVEITEVLRSEESIDSPALFIDPDAMAYIFYTSGSTGNPKGVCQSQRNLYHFICVYSETLNVCERDRLSLLYSLGFSASNMDVFSAILNGATLCLYDIRKLGTAGLGDWMDEMGITLLHAVPTVFRHLCSSLSPGRKLEAVRAIDLGGEAVYKSDISLLKNAFPKGSICVNHLAATEASVIAQYRIDPEFEYDTEILPVGYAADGIELRVIDASSGESVPDGQIGEIQVASQYISSGYWNLPDLNKKVFIEDPKHPNCRLYQSGDLGFYADDGKLHFLGRKDHRVKIRGFSVDTNEVEAAIRHCAPDLQDVAVVARQLDASLPLQLTAFLAVRETTRFDLKVLRADLALRVASYMLPSDYILMPRLPENASGKLDRKLLVQSNLREEQLADEHRSLETRTEKRVAEIIKNILNIKHVGRDDDFFNLGGDSLRATELHAIIEIEFGIRMPLYKLLEKADLKFISSQIDKQLDDTNTETHSKPQALISLRQAGSKPPIFLTHGLNGQAFVSPHFLSILGLDQPVYAFQATGLKRDGEKHLSIAEMAEQYIVEIRKIQENGPYLLISICSGCILSLEIADQLLSTGEAVSPLLMIDPPMNPPGELGCFKRWKRRRKDRKEKSKKEANFRKSLTKKLIKHERQGRITLDLADEKSMNQAINAAFHFSFALNNYRIKAYSGEVILMGSRDRLSQDSGKLRKKLIGPVEYYDVGEKHSDIHKVTNELFATMLKRSVETAIQKMETLR